MLIITLLTSLPVIQINSYYDHRENVLLLLLDQCLPPFPLSGISVASTATGHSGLRKPTSKILGY
ncbi:MAG: hypothetical protein ACK5H1_09435 [Tenacibaculum sp.]